MFDFHTSDIKNEIVVSGGIKILLFDSLGKYKYLDSDCRARNIYALDSNDQIVWRVFSDFDSDGDPFINVRFKSGRLTAYRWDGGEYLIDITTGKAEPHAFLK
jgi:hypothetical protein